MVVSPVQVSLLSRPRGCAAVPCGTEGAVRLNEEMTPFEDDEGEGEHGSALDTEKLSWTCGWMRSGPLTPWGVVR